MRSPRQRRCQYDTNEGAVFSRSVQLHVALPRTLAVQLSALGVQKWDFLPRFPIESMSEDFIALKVVADTVILQIFGVVLFSVISVVNGVTEIKKTPKWKKYIERLQQRRRTPKF